MLLLYVLCIFFLKLVAAIATSTRHNSAEKPFACTGGAVYFTAHAVDSLLFQNPDLFHDLYVFKCVTTVVFTSGDRGVADNNYLSLERGLNEAYAWMANSPAHTWKRRNTTALIGKYKVHSWSRDDLPNMQILYLRLPDGAPHGHGYDVYGGQSLMKLYQNEIKSITTVDGNGTYTINQLEELIATVLHQRRPNNVLVSDHKATPHSDYGAGTDHADHIFSAKLVMDVIEKDNIDVNVQSYAGEFMKKLQPNLKSTQPDFNNKAKAFFRYAVYDKGMCQTIAVCQDRLVDKETQLDMDGDRKYVAQYLEREYFVY